MPSNDLILNVRQIANYPSASGANSNDAILIQQGGLGGPYASIQPQDFVVSALFNAKSVTIQGELTAYSFQGGNITASNAQVNALTATNASIFSLNLGGGSINGDPLATRGFVGATTVSSVNNRRGDVVLGLGDIENAGGAPIYSPVFRGIPQAPTPMWNDCSNQIATTAYAQQAASSQIAYLLDTQPFVFTWNGRSGAVTLTMEDLVGADGALLQSPAFVGDPTAPTPPQGDSDTSIATTEFVSVAIAANNNGLEATLAGIYAPINNAALTGIPTAPTAAAGTHSGQLATTAFVMNALSASVAGVATWNGRGGNVTMTSADITSAGGALLASPSFTGVPLAPTASPGTNTTQLATCAYVQAAVSAGTAGVSSFNTRTGAVTLSSADITGAGGALINSPTFTGTPAAPTAVAGTSTTQLATCAFVSAAVAAATAGVASFNGRTGAVTLNASDLSAAGGLSNPSAALTGAPTSTTPTTGTNNTQIATTAFVQASLAAGAVTTFNTRSGAVTLTTADITGAGGAPLAAPAFTGVPTAPTATAGTSTTQLATTAFVAAAIAAGGGSTPSTTVPLMDGTAAIGSLTSSFALADHVHPHDTSMVPLAGGVTISGTLQVNGMLTSNSFQAVGPVAFTALPTTNPGSNQAWNNQGAVTVGAGKLYLSTAGGTLSGGLVVLAPVDLIVQNVTAAATTTINRSLGENVSLSLGTSITALSISPWASSGITSKLRLVIISTGTYTIAWPPNTKWAGGTAPTLTPNGTDIILLMTDTQGNTIYGSVVGQGYA